MKVFIVVIGCILATVAQNGNNLSDLNDIVICATFNNVNRTFDNIWQVYNEFKTSGELWTPVATGACPVNNIDCTILNPVCAVSSNNFFKTFPNQCVLEAEQKSTGTVWKIVFNGICSANPGDGFVNSTSAPPPVTPAPGPWYVKLPAQQSVATNVSQPPLSTASISSNYAGTPLQSNQQPVQNDFGSANNNQNIAQSANALSFVYCLPSPSSSTGSMTSPVTQFNPVCFTVPTPPLSPPSYSTPSNTADSPISPAAAQSSFSSSAGSSPESISFNTIPLTNPALLQIFSSPSTASIPAYPTPGISVPSPAYSVPSYPLSSLPPTSYNSAFNPAPVPVPVQSYSPAADDSPSPAAGLYRQDPAPIPPPTHPVPSSNHVSSPISDQYNSATAPVSSYSAPTFVPVSSSYSVATSDVGTSPITGDYHPAPASLATAPYSSSNPTTGNYSPVSDTAPSSSYSSSLSDTASTSSADAVSSLLPGNADSPIYNSYDPASAPSSSLYSSSLSNPVPLPISYNYNPVPAPSYISDQLKPASSPVYSSDITSSPAPGYYASVDISQPSPTYSGAYYAGTAPTLSDCNKTPSADAASSSSYPATANNNLSPAPSYATILSDPVSPQFSSASAPSPSLYTNQDSISLNAIPLTNSALLNIFSPSVDPAPSAYSPPATPVSSTVYSSPSADSLPPLPSQPYSAATLNQSAAYINVPDSPVLSAPDYTSPAVSISEAVSQYSNPSESNSASPTYLQQSKSGQAPYSNTSPLLLSVPLTPTVTNVQYPAADDNSATNNYAQQTEPIATVQQTEENYQQSADHQSYGLDTPSSSHSYQPPSDTPSSSTAVDAACSNAAIYTSPVHNYENLPSNSNDVPAINDNYADKPNDFYNNNINTDLANQNKYAHEENSEPAPLTADNSNQNSDTEAQTIYNGVVYQGPYYYEPKYKHINYGNFNFLPTQNQNTASAAAAPVTPAVPALVSAHYSGFSMNPFEQLLKQLQYIATRNVTSGY